MFRLNQIVTLRLYVSNTSHKYKVKKKMKA